MKIIFITLLYLIIANCSYKNETYWCGDHPCINKKEREAYFKKTLIVEIKNLNNKDVTRNSEIEKIVLHAKVDEKKRITNEKLLKKEVKLEKKRKKKEEKLLLKQAKIDKKRLNKKMKILKKNKIQKNVNVDNSFLSINRSTKFDDLVNAITSRNENKPFPNINGNQQ